VLTRFNGQPVVSLTGRSCITDLQITASQRHPHEVPVPTGVKGAFAASSGQILLSAGCVLNFVGALVLGSLLADGIAELGGLVAFVQGIYWLLLGYGTASLACRWYVISDSVAQ